MAWTLVKYGFSLIGLFATISGLLLLFTLQAYNESSDVLLRQLRTQRGAGNQMEGLCTFHDDGCRAVKLANCTSGSCEGVGIVHVPCTAENCPAIWSEWVVTNTINGSLFIRNRKRNCTNIENVPNCSDFQTESVTCNTSLWSSWSDWQCTQIKKSCTARRSRQCYSGLDNASCNGTNNEEDTCTSSRCLGQSVSFWNEWSDHKCFYEKNSCLHIRNRTCSTGVNNDCEGKYYNVSGDCSKNCYGDWSDWSGWECKEGDGVYTAERIRNCSAVAPKICEGSANETYSCGTDPCPVCSDLTTLNVTNGPNAAANLTAWECFEANGLAYRIRYSTLCKGTDCKKQENYQLDWCNLAKCPDCYNGSTPIVHSTDPPKLNTVTGTDSTDNPWDHWKCLNDTETGLMFRVEHKDCNTTDCVGENHALQPCNEMECPECFPNTGQGNDKCYDEIGTGCTSLVLLQNKCEDPGISAKCRKTCKLCGSSQTTETTIAITETTTTRSSTANLSTDSVSVKLNQTEPLTFSTIKTSLTTKQTSASKSSFTTRKDLTTDSSQDLSTIPSSTTSKDLTTDSSQDISTSHSLTTIIEQTSNESIQSTSTIAEAVSTTSSELTSSMQTTTFTSVSSTNASFIPTDTTKERTTTTKGSEVIPNTTDIISETSASSKIPTTTDSLGHPFTTANKIGVDTCFDDPSIACNAFDGNLYCNDVNTAWTKCRKTCNLCDASSSTQSVTGQTVTRIISAEPGTSTLNPTHLLSENSTTTTNSLMNLTTDSPDSFTSSNTTSIYTTNLSLTSSAYVTGSPTNTLAFTKTSSPLSSSGINADTVNPNTAIVDLSMTTASYPTNPTSNPNITSITKGSSTYLKTTLIPTLSMVAGATQTNKPTEKSTPSRTSTTKTTTKMPTSTVQTGHTIPPTPTKCAVCFGPPELCDELYEIQTCPAPDNYCINYIKNYDDGSRRIQRGCGNHTRCYREWFQGSSDNDKCQNFMEDNVITLEFECTYCCIKDECNVKMYPALDTLYKDV